MRSTGDAWSAPHRPAPRDARLIEDDVAAKNMACIPALSMELPVVVAAEHLRHVHETGARSDSIVHGCTQII